MGIFNNRIVDSDKLTKVPVWFMRQAGRYHGHYQKIRREHDFMSMCKNAELACEITMGPVEEFDFDAAILFSDLLFPLEQLNFGLSYLSGPPTLEMVLDSPAAISKLESSGKKASAEEFYAFQKKALLLIKKKLKAQKTLLGFVGAPFTLYTYACEGKHSGNLVSSKNGLYDGRYELFLKILLPDLLANMKIQAQGGADAVCLFDTAAGELCLEDYKHFIVPGLRQLAALFKSAYPKVKLVYYSKMTNAQYLETIQCRDIDVLGVDWRCDIKGMLEQFSGQYYIQGNIDPAWLFLPWDVLKTKLDGYWLEVSRLPAKMLQQWICGLGHGVLPGTPEENVRNTVQHIKANFRY